MTSSSWRVNGPYAWKHNPKSIVLEEAISYIEDDEQVEVTPESIRLRKAILDPHERKRAERSK